MFSMAVVSDVLEIDHINEEIFLSTVDFYQSMPITPCAKTSFQLSMKWTFFSFLSAYTGFILTGIYSSLKDFLSERYLTQRAVTSNIDHRKQQTMNEILVIVNENWDMSFVNVYFVKHNTATKMQISYFAEHLALYITFCTHQRSCIYLYTYVCVCVQNACPRVMGNWFISRKQKTCISCYIHCFQ